MQRDSFVIYKSFYALIKLLPKSERLTMFEAIFEFGFSEEEPELESEAQKAIWMAIRPQLVANNRRYVNGCKGTEYGRLGGRPSKKDGEESAENETPKGIKTKTPNETPKGIREETPKITPNENENVNVNDNENDITPLAFIDKSISPKGKEKASFKVPTIEEIRDYCKERGNSVDAEMFYDFYESKGWFVGKSKMKDWQASVRTWERSEKPQRKKTEEEGIPYAN